MVVRALPFVALLGILAAPGLAEVAAETSVEAGPAADQPLARERPRARPLGGTDAADRRCTADGRLCITRATYAADVCRAMEVAAAAVALDPGFFARLLWRESLFDADAVSPAGAQGIAQFMPGTAEQEGLADPFNPAEAIGASAAYLKELEGRFGNLGLAAAAYNAGEERVQRFVAGTGGLPGETRAYVPAITGHAAEAWRDGPLPEPDLALDPDLPFEEACLARAEGRGIPAFRSPVLPWGVIIAGRGSRESAEREALGLMDGHDALLAGERIDYTHERLPGMQQTRHFAQVGRETRAEADALCGRLRAAGAGCIVRRN